DLLLRAPATVPEVLAEGLELDVVPPEADAEAKPPAREQVDSGGLFGGKRRLPLRQDEHAGDQLEPRRNRGQVAEEDEQVGGLGLRRGRAGAVGSLPGGG